jgi:hypothetical protein
MWPVKRSSKRIPANVIHSLKADLHRRIDKADNRITAIPADGYN